MREITKKYSGPLIIYFVLVAVIFSAWISGNISWTAYISSIWCLFGIFFLYWGYYNMKGREAYNIAIKMNFFIGKKNHADYDTERMLRDGGKFLIILGASVVAVGVLFYFTSNVYIMLFTSVYIMAVCIAFLVICRKSKYLKNH